MLHGLLGGPENWDAILRCLPDSCSAEVPCLPFFDDGANLDTVPDVTDYALKCIDDANIDEMVLMGNSLGGHVAINLTDQMPDRIKGLVLTASSGLFERGSSFPGTKPSRDWIKDKCREVFYSPKFITEKLVDEIIELVTNRRMARTLVRLAKSAKRDNVKEKLNKISCPVLLVWGKQDVITPPEVAEEFQREIPNSQLVFLDECCHAPPIEQPEKFAEQLNLWWNSDIHPPDKIAKAEGELAT